MTQKTTKEEIKDYEFLDSKNKKIKLSEIFGKKDDLILIHNMGVSCPYCTLWADGFNGILQHLEDMVAFVVVSNDTPQVQKKFVKSRKWKFKMLSANGTSFSDDMGFKSKNGFEPGASIFHKDGSKIYRVSNASFSPGDDYCIAWHFLDLLPGKKDWQPKFRYK